MAQIQPRVPDSALGFAFQINDAEASGGTGPTRQGFTVVLLALSSLAAYIGSVLTKFHAGYFRIALSLAAQSLLLKRVIIGHPATAAHPGTAGTGTDGPLHRLVTIAHPTTVLLVLWFLALVTLISLSLVYFLRCVFRFELVKAEFFHRVGVNYLFTPWISCLLLIQAAPFMKPGAAAPSLILWWVFVIPVVALDVKIYGQWLTKGKRLLSTAANPTSLLSVIANLVAAKAAAQLAWKESAVCLFSLGMVHYTVLFVTLRQRLSGDDSIPPMLRPTFFLFFAAPGAASLAWESIAGGFDMASKMLFFLSLFLFTSLVCRPTLFKRSMRRFNVAWWAYSFPLTLLALASIEYTRAVNGCVSRALMLVLSTLSVLVSLGLTILTLLNTRMLLPDDDPSLTILEHHACHQPYDSGTLNRAV